MTFMQVVSAVVPSELTGTYRKIVHDVKAHQTADALAALKPHLREDGYVLSAQNGLNGIAITQAVGSERTMGCFVNQLFKIQSVPDPAAV
jgi:2-dehydropantoate 2-reductase